MDKHGYKRLFLVAGTIVAALLITVGYYLWYRRGLTVVQTGSVTRQDLTAVVSASGEIKPLDYVNISASAFGKILEVHVREGESVRKDQLLARLEAIQPEADVKGQQAQVEAATTEVRGAQAVVDSMKASLRTTEASLVRVRALYERAQQDFSRATALSEEQLISRASFEQARADHDVAKASVAEAEARFAQAQAQLQQAIAQAEVSQERVRQSRAALDRIRDTLSKYSFVSPIDGVVTDLPVSVGENVVPGVQNAPGSLLMTIANLSTITAEVLVDETEISRVLLGQQARIAVDAFPDQPFSAHVTEIGNTAVIRSTGLAAAQSNTSSQQAKDFKIVLTLESPAATLRPGLSATAEITTATHQDALVIPLQALSIRSRREIDASTEPGAVNADSSSISSGSRLSDDVEGVFVVRDGRANFQPVKTGISGITEIEILSGLQEGDEIVIGNYEALRTLKSGDRVRVDNSSNRREAQSF
ncbi:MAG: hypothetical protein A3F68_07540 [Acidobacteria bacterium RIFCSPLOWO2_12_FULL_54_10]|nr:MAG: hypothetical protein A3F68_07540 [Acidobacteria bacterium RIFCSPLOWO2_12_FULL_54_10]